MKTMMVAMTLARAFAVLAVACALTAASLAAPRAQEKGPAGMWRVQFATPLGQVGVNMTINLKGTRLSGQVTDEYGEWPITGEFDSASGRVTVVWSVPEEGKMLEITMKGALQGDEIRGTAKLGDVGEGPLVARRTGDAG